MTAPRVAAAGRETSMEEANQQKAGRENVDQNGVNREGANREGTTRENRKQEGMDVDERKQEGANVNDTDQQKEKQQKEYAKYVKEVTPTHNLGLQMLKAFITGGIICCLGQFILDYAGSQGLDKQTAGSWCSLILVLLSVILTGFGIYPKIVKWGGAGALVPITGFANSVAAPAIEYKSEGQVFGIGCKIFTIAGPVILYGLLASWVLGLGYWIGMMLGWIQA